MGVLRISNSIPRDRDVRFNIKNTRNNNTAMTSRLSNTNTSNENGSPNAHVVNPGEGKVPFYFFSRFDFINREIFLLAIFFADKFAFFPFFKIARIL